MNTEASAEAGQCPSGVYVIDAGERARVLSGKAFPADYVVAVLDGEEAGSRAGFFTEIARTLHFPDYFGHNWDAVYDCLTDPSVLLGTGTVIVLDGYGQFARHDPEQWATGLKVLGDACAFWRPLSRPMVVLLFDLSETAPGVPPLPEGCLPPSGTGTRGERAAEGDRAPS